MTCLVGKGQAVDVVYLDLRKILDTVTFSILLKSLPACSPKPGEKKKKKETLKKIGRLVACVVLS